MGFDICEFEPEETEKCEKCREGGRQLFSEGPSDAGRYLCLSCILEEYDANQAQWPRSPCRSKLDSNPPDSAIRSNQREPHLPLAAIHRGRAPRAQETGPHHGNHPPHRSPVLLCSAWQQPTNPFPFLLQTHTSAIPRRSRRKAGEHVPVTEAPITFPPESPPHSGYALSSGPLHPSIHRPLFFPDITKCSIVLPTSPGEEDDGTEGAIQEAPLPCLRHGFMPNPRLGDRQKTCGAGGDPGGQGAGAAPGPGGGGAIERRIQRRIKESKLPELKLLADYDFALPVTPAQGRAISPMPFCSSAARKTIAAAILWLPRCCRNCSRACRPQPGGQAQALPRARGAPDL